jgi:hypothetical protein
MKTLASILALFLLSLSNFALALPAFPGAMGGGAIATGGRGGVVMQVNSLSDSGTGTLRACIEASGARTCVFTVSGTINLQTRLTVVNDNLTIAGQTAPGGGIQLNGTNKTSGSMLTIDANNVIIRYIRVRQGYNASCTGECGAGIMIYGDNTIVDHVTVQWTIDEGIGSWGWSGSSPKNFTVSYCLVAEGFGTHSTAYITGGDNAGSQINLDYHHNLAMNNKHRNPLLKNETSRYVNNLHYNNQWYVVQILGTRTDVIGNHFIKGPMKISGPYVDRHEIGMAGPGSDSPNGNTPSVYLSGNTGWNQTTPSNDQWVMAATVTGENGTETGTVTAAWKRTTPQPDTPYPIIAESVTSLEANLLPIVGAGRRVDCNGNWVSNRDASETRLITQYETDTGITALPTNESQVGGFPTLASGTACSDKDRDGMPDVWEESRGYNPNSSANRNFIAPNGYTFLENYLNGQ